MTLSARAPDIAGRLAILAGKGRFPVLVAEAARELGHDPYIFAIRGEADQDWSGFDHCEISIADLAGFARTVRRHSIGSVVLAGGISPSRHGSAWLHHITEATIGGTCCMRRWRSLRCCG